MILVLPVDHVASRLLRSDWWRCEAASDDDGRVSVQGLVGADPQRDGRCNTLHGCFGFCGMERIHHGVTDEYEQVVVNAVRADLIDQGEVRERFARKPEALRNAQGEHIASLVDASDANDEQPGLAKEYVRGLTLKEFVSEWAR